MNVHDSASHQLHILVFVKYWEYGSKTRLVPAVGKQGAALVSKWLTERCVNTVRTFADKHPGTLVHFWCGGTTESVANMREWLITRNGESFTHQCEGDLGDRLTLAFESAFKNGAQKVVVVGTDIPEIDESILKQAFQALDKVDVIIGPAADGGYYLLGNKKPECRLFQNISWSSAKVFRETIRAIQRQQLTFTTLRTLRDIDVPGDLPYLEQVSGYNVKQLSELGVKPLFKI